MDTGIQEASLAEHARQCILSFDECESHAARLPPQGKAMIEDQVGRFSVWASNIGVLAPARASLDYRLREAEDVRRLVMALLITLDASIQEYTSSLGRPDVSQDGSHVDNASLSSSLGPILKEIADHISLLHQTSNLIRKASSKKHHIKAASDFVIRDENGDDYGPKFRDDFALRIIRQLFPQCADGIQERLADVMLLRRKQILYRYSRYGKSPLSSTASAPPARIPVFVNNQNVAQGVSNTADPQPGSSTNPKRSVASSRAPTATTLDNDQWQKVSTAPSIVSTPTIFQPTRDNKLSFPNAPKKSIRARLKALKTAREADLQRRLESIPDYDIYQQHGGQPPLDPEIIEQIQEVIDSLKAETKEDIERDEESCCKGSMEATCPYCCCIISSAIIMNRNKWDDHVRHDIGPYVCLFENCDTPDILYNHSSSWLKHMRQHNRRWCCAAKAHGVLVFQTQSEYEQHMANKHKAMKAQPELLTERQYRSSGPLFQSCPLCGATDLDTSLERHIASHLVFLALKCLPSLDDGEDCDSLSDTSRESDSESGSVRSKIRHTDRLSEERSHISATDAGSVGGDESDTGTGAPNETSIDSRTLSPLHIEETEARPAPDGPENPGSSGSSETRQVESLEPTSSGFAERHSLKSPSGAPRLDYDLSTPLEIMVRLPGDDLSLARPSIAAGALDTQCDINIMSSRVWAGLNDDGRWVLEAPGVVCVRGLGSGTLPVIGVARGLEWHFKHRYRTYIDDFHVIDMERFDVLIGSDTIHKYQLFMPGPDIQEYMRRESDEPLQLAVGLQEMSKDKGEKKPVRGVRKRIMRWAANRKEDR